MENDIKQANQFIQKINILQQGGAKLEDYIKTVNELEYFIEKNCDCPTIRNEQGFIKICTCNN